MRNRSIFRTRRLAYVMGVCTFLLTSSFVWADSINLIQEGLGTQLHRSPVFQDTQTLDVTGDLGSIPMGEQQASFFLSTPGVVRLQDGFASGQSKQMVITPETLPILEPIGHHVVFRGEVILLIMDVNSQGLNDVEYAIRKEDGSLYETCLPFVSEDDEDFPNLKDGCKLPIPFDNPTAYAFTWRPPANTPVGEVVVRFEVKSANSQHVVFEESTLFVRENQFGESALTGLHDLPEGEVVQALNVEIPYNTADTQITPQMDTVEFGEILSVYQLERQKPFDPTEDSAVTTPLKTLSSVLWPQENADGDDTLKANNFVTTLLQDSELASLANGAHKSYTFTQDGTSYTFDVKKNGATCPENAEEAEAVYCSHNPHFLVTEGDFDLILEGVGSYDIDLSSMISNNDLIPGSFKEVYSLEWNAFGAYASEPKGLVLSSAGILSLPAMNLQQIQASDDPVVVAHFEMSSAPDLAGRVRSYDFTLSADETTFYINAVFQDPPLSKSGDDYLLSLNAFIPNDEVQFTLESDNTTFNGITTPNRVTVENSQNGTLRIQSFAQNNILSFYVHSPLKRYRFKVEKHANQWLVDVETQVRDFQDAEVAQEDYESPENLPDANYTQFFDENTDAVQDGIVETPGGNEGGYTMDLTEFFEFPNDIELVLSDSDSNISLNEASKSIQMTGFSSDGTKSFTLNYGGVQYATTVTQTNGALSVSIEANAANKEPEVVSVQEETPVVFLPKNAEKQRQKDLLKELDRFFSYSDTPGMLLSSQGIYTNEQVTPQGELLEGNDKALDGMLSLELSVLPDHLFRRELQLEFCVVMATESTDSDNDRVADTTSSFDFEDNCLRPLLVWDSGAQTFRNHIDVEFPDLSITQKNEGGYEYAQAEESVYLDLDGSEEPIEEEVGFSENQKILIPEFKPLLMDVTFLVDPNIIDALEQHAAMNEFLGHFEHSRNAQVQVRVNIGSSSEWKKVSDITLFKYVEALGGELIEEQTSENAVSCVSPGRLQEDADADAGCSTDTSERLGRRVSGSLPDELQIVEGIPVQYEHFNSEHVKVYHDLRDRVAKYHADQEVILVQENSCNFPIIRAGETDYCRNTAEAQIIQRAYIRNEKDLFRMGMEHAKWKGEENVFIGVNFLEDMNGDGFFDLADAQLRVHLSSGMEEFRAHCPQLSTDDINCLANDDITYGLETRLNFYRNYWDEYSTLVWKIAHAEGVYLPSEGDWEYQVDWFGSDLDGSEIKEPQVKVTVHGSTKFNEKVSKSLLFQILTRYQLYDVALRGIYHSYLDFFKDSDDDILWVANAFYKVTSSGGFTDFIRVWKKTSTGSESKMARFPSRITGDWLEHEPLNITDLAYQQPVAEGHSAASAVTVPEEDKALFRAKMFWTLFKGGKVHKSMFSPEPTLSDSDNPWVTAEMLELPSEKRLMDLVRAMMTDYVDYAEQYAENDDSVDDEDPVYQVRFNFVERKIYVGIKTHPDILKASEVTPLISFQTVTTDHTETFESVLSGWMAKYASEDKRFGKPFIQDLITYTVTHDPYDDIDHQPGDRMELLYSIHDWTRDEVTVAYRHVHPHPNPNIEGTTYTYAKRDWVLSDTQEYFYKLLEVARLERWMISTRDEGLSNIYIAPMSDSGSDDEGWWYQLHNDSGELKGIESFSTMAELDEEFVLAVKEHDSSTSIYPRGLRDPDNASDTTRSLIPDYQALSQTMLIATDSQYHIHQDLQNKLQEYYDDGTQSVLDEIDALRGKYGDFSPVASPRFRVVFNTRDSGSSTKVYAHLQPRAVPLSTGYFWSELEIHPSRLATHAQEYAKYGFKAVSYGVIEGRDQFHAGGQSFYIMPGAGNPVSWDQYPAILPIISINATDDEHPKPKVMYVGNLYEESSSYNNYGISSKTDFLNAAAVLATNPNHGNPEQSASFNDDWNYDPLLHEETYTTPSTQWTKWRAVDDEKLLGSNNIREYPLTRKYLRTLVTSAKEVADKILGADSFSYVNPGSDEYDKDVTLTIDGETCDLKSNATDDSGNKMYRFLFQGMTAAGTFSQQMRDLQRDTVNHLDQAQRQINAPLDNMSDGLDQLKHFLNKVLALNGKSLLREQRYLGNTYGNKSRLAAGYHAEGELSADLKGAKAFATLDVPIHILGEKVGSLFYSNNHYEMPFELMQQITDELMNYVQTMLDAQAAAQSHIDAARDLASLNLNELEGVIPNKDQLSQFQIKPQLESILRQGQKIDTALEEAFVRYGLDDAFWGGCTDGMKQVFKDRVLKYYSPRHGSTEVIDYSLIDYDDFENELATRLPTLKASDLVNIAKDRLMKVAKGSQFMQNLEGQLGDIGKVGSGIHRAELSMKNALTKAKELQDRADTIKENVMESKLETIGWSFYDKQDSAKGQDLHWKAEPIGENNPGHPGLYYEKREGRGTTIVVVVVPVRFEAGGFARMGLFWDYGMSLLSGIMGTIEGFADVGGYAEAYLSLSIEDVLADFGVPRGLINLFDEFFSFSKLYLRAGVGGEIVLLSDTMKVEAFVKPAISNGIDLEAKVLGTNTLSALLGELYSFVQWSEPKGIKFKKWNPKPKLKIRKKERRQTFVRFKGSEFPVNTFLEETYSYPLLKF